MKVSCAKSKQSIHSDVPQSRTIACATGLRYLMWEVSEGILANMHVESHSVYQASHSCLSCAFNVELVWRCSTFLRAGREEVLDPRQEKYSQVGDRCQSVPSISRRAWPSGSRMVKAEGVLLSCLVLSRWEANMTGLSHAEERGEREFFLSCVTFCHTGPAFTESVPSFKFQKSVLKVKLKCNFNRFVITKKSRFSYRQLSSDAKTFHIKRKTSRIVSRANQVC